LSLAAREVHPRRAHGAAHVHARVCPEVLVLRRGDGRDERGRRLLPRQVLATAFSSALINFL
jgi:hypothetical protein